VDLYWEAKAKLVTTFSLVDTKAGLSDGCWTTGKASVLETYIPAGADVLLETVTMNSDSVGSDAGVSPAGVSTEAAVTGTIDV